MATIKIDTLKVTGSELFGDQESFLNELTDAESLTSGGLYWSNYTSIIVTTTVMGPVIF